jgi:hypothetical protein
MAAGDDYYEDLIKINLQYEGERNIAENVLFASCLGAHGASADDLDDLAHSISSAWIEYLMPYIGSTISLVNCLVADWTDADGLTGVYPVDQEGGLTGDPMTDQVAVLINEQSLMRYRGGRGRIYLPQPDVTVIDNGTTWTDEFIGHITDGIVDVLNVINALSIGDDLLTSVLYHRPGSKVVAQGYEDIIAASCSPTPGTQRRRVRRVGHKR